MFLAPTPPLTAQIVPMALGRAGVDQTLFTMRLLVQRYRTDLAIHQQAISIIFTLPQKNELLEVCALFEYVQRYIRYVRDIHQVETIATPDKTMAMQIGDCDDKTVLLATLLETVGYPTRFVVAGYNYPDELEHVYLQVYADDDWINLDATENKPMGYAPPDPVTILIEDV